MQRVQSQLTQHRKSTEFRMNCPNPIPRSHRHLFAPAAQSSDTRSTPLGRVAALVLILSAATTTRLPAQTVPEAQAKIVKIYGAGGIRGLEAYQSGFLISKDGHVLTSFSYVLDTDDVIVTLADGRDFTAATVGIDPRLELAVLKIDATDLPFFDLSKGVRLETGSRILAFSNLFGIAAGNEPASVMHGVIMAISKLSARRGNFKIPYQGEVYIVDAITNNPGAAGGALTNLKGELVAMLGKELRSADANVWINYALPVDSIRDSVQALQNGTPLPNADENTTENLAKQPWTIQHTGILFIPDVLAKTPPFVESVYPDSPAANVGVRPDDLVMYVGTELVRSYRDLVAALERIENQDDLEITVLREQKLVPLTIQPADIESAP